MKYILMFLLVVSANAGVITSIQGFTMEERKPDAVYQLDTAGQNVRVYEFTPKTEPSQRCIIVFTESDKKAPVMSCVTKTK